MYRLGSDYFSSGRKMGDHVTAGKILELSSNGGKTGVTDEQKQRRFFRTFQKSSVRVIPSRSLSSPRTALEALQIPNFKKHWSFCSAGTLITYYAYSSNITLYLNSKTYAASLQTNYQINKLVYVIIMCLR